MRLIDADKILDALSIFTDKENGNKHFMYGIETAKELIEDALEEQEENAGFGLEEQPIGLAEAIDRLVAYENTGLMPAEVQLISNVLREVGETYNCHFNFVVKVLKEYAELGGAKHED